MAKKILFICLGNICRSCTAEEIFRVKAKDFGLAEKYTADSAGLIDYHEGEMPDSRMRTAAARHGYQLSHRSRPVTRDDFEKADLIVAMDESNRKRLEKLSPSPILRKKIVMMANYMQHPHAEITHIPDPYYGDEKDFEQTVLLLEDACEGLLHALRQGKT